MKNWKGVDQSLFTIKNIQTLVEMLKIKNGISLAIVRRFNHIMCLSDFSFSNFSFFVMGEVLELLLGCLTSLFDRYSSDMLVI